MERTPAVAGLFYPADEAALRVQVRDFLGETLEHEHVAVAIAPHAGYQYSGAIAAAVYRRIHVPKTAIVLCPNHTGLGARNAIVTRGHFRIPGARVPIDSGVAEAIREVGLLAEDSLAHSREHSLEVHLPFLLARNPKIRIVPICLGSTPYAGCVRIGIALADVVIRHGRDILIVASTDMSHYVPADQAREQDRLALDRIQALDPEGLYETVFGNDISMCGVIPVTVAMIAAKALGATEATILQYGNSGETSGDYERVVGYASAIIR